MHNQTPIASRETGDLSCTDASMMHALPAHARRTWRYLSLVAIASAMLLQAAQVAAAIVPAARMIPWQGNVGVAGDIPNRTSVCATLSPRGSGLDDTSAILNAINACPANGVVLLKPGTFLVTSINITRSNMTLRGAGMGVTVLKGTSTSSPYILGVNQGSFDWDLNGEATYDITAGYGKGSTTITTSTAHDWTVGDLILIDQANNLGANPPISSTGTGGTCNWCGRWGGGKPAGQLAKIVAVPSANSATLEIPLYWNYDPATIQGTRVRNVVSGVGIEDLSVDNTTSWNDSQINGGTVGFYFVQNSWVLRIEINGVVREGISLYVSYRNTIRSNAVHRSLRYISSNGYGIFMMPATSATLVEDNQFHDLAVGMMMAGVNSGNVLAYNYVANLKNTDFPLAVRYGIDFHGAHPFMNLIEGNFLDGSFIAADSYWGTASHNTFLRNKVAIDTNKENEAANMRFFKDNWYFNLVGNVLGTIGNETIYEGQWPYGIRMAYELDTSNGNLGASDGQTKATMIRHGNWDSVNRQVLWDSTIADRSVPASYYLAAKPAFFGSCAWPNIGPDITSFMTTLPAQSRYQGTNPCAGATTGGVSAPLPAPTNLRVK